MKRGEVWLVQLDPVKGSEVGKRRPAVVLQNDLANLSSPTVTVLPLTTNADRVFPFQVLLEAGEGGLQRPTKVLCEQIRTVVPTAPREAPGHPAGQPARGDPGRARPALLVRARLPDLRLLIARGLAAATEC
jgi:mRNA interferase MazF